MVTRELATDNATFEALQVARNIASCHLVFKLISSPHCAVSGFVFISVLNSLIRSTSVIAYMKFLSRPFTGRFVQVCSMS